MSGIRVNRLPIPEGGDERNVVWYRHHNCRNAKAFRVAMDNEDIDYMQFSVGSHGEGMPMGIPFRVTSTNPCGVCGEYPSMWFEWVGRLVFL